MHPISEPGARAAQVRFVTLDGLRGVVALFIVFFHHRWWTDLSMHYGYIAIDFFWLLSGFVIAHAYGHKLASGAMDARTFVRVRIERLWPLIIFGAALGTIVDLGESASAGWMGGAVRAIAAFPLTALLVPIPWSESPFPVNEPMWSLFFEVLGNVFFLAVAARLTPRSLRITIALLTCFMLGLFLIGGTISYGFRWDWLMLGFPRMLFSFMVGVGLYWLWERNLLPRIGMPFWALSLLLLFILAIVPELDGPFDPAFVALCVMVLFPLVIVSGCQSQPQGAWKRIAEFSAEISYPLYIVHYPILFALDELFPSTPPAHAELILLVEVIAICAFAWATGRYYERPMRKWLASFRHRTTTPKAGPLQAEQDLR